MLTRRLTRLTWVAAGILLVAGGADAQPIPTTGGTPTVPKKPGGIGTPGSPGSGKLGTPAGMGGSTVPTGGLGGPPFGGIGGGTTGGGLGGGLPQLSPEVERQVLEEALVLAEWFAEAYDMQFASEFDALLLFLQMYQMRYMAAVQQKMMTTPGGFGGGTLPAKP